MDSENNHSGGGAQNLTNPEFVVATDAVVNITLNQAGETLHCQVRANGSSVITINASNSAYAVVRITGDTKVIINQTSPCKIVVIKEMVNPCNPTVEINGSGSFAVFIENMESVYQRGGGLFTENGSYISGYEMYQNIKPLDEY